MAAAWPPTEAAVGRRAGAFVVLVDGALAAYLERGGRRLVTFTTDEGVLSQVAAEVEAIGKRRLRRMELETIDGDPAAKTQLGAILTELGFRTSYKGLVLRP